MESSGRGKCVGGMKLKDVDGKWMQRVGRAGQCKWKESKNVKSEGEVGGK